MIIFYFFAFALLRYASFAIVFARLSPFR